MAGLLGASAAQASTLPTLSVAINKASATVSGPLESGAVNIVTTDTGVKEAGVIIFQLEPGVTVAEAETFVKEKKGKGDPGEARLDRGRYGSERRNEGGKRRPSFCQGINSCS